MIDEAKIIIFVEISQSLVCIHNLLIFQIDWLVDADTAANLFEFHQIPEFSNHSLQVK